MIDNLTICFPCSPALHGNAFIETLTQCLTGVSSHSYALHGNERIPNTELLFEKLLCVVYRTSLRDPSLQDPSLRDAPRTASSGHRAARSLLPRSGTASVTLSLSKGSGHRSY